MIDELNGDFLQWLRGFYFVAKTGSVRKAAELMHRNPSTISYQLHSLEDELGVTLFDRHKKSLRITGEGETVLKWAISTFDTLQNLISSVGSNNGTLQGSIRMAATLPIATMAVGVISDFIRRNPNVDLYIERFLSENVRRRVEDSIADFGLLPVISRQDKKNLEVIARSRPVLVLHRDNPWQIPAIPSLDDLRQLPYVAFGEQDCPDDLGNYMELSGMGDFIRKNAVLKVNNYHLIMRFVWQKLGVAIMDEMCCQGTIFGADWQDIHKIPLDHLFPNCFYGLLTRPARKLTPQAAALMNELRDHFMMLSRYEPDCLWEKTRQRASPKADNR